MTLPQKVIRYPKEMPMNGPNLLAGISETRRNPRNKYAKIELPPGVTGSSSVSHNAFVGDTVISNKQEEFFGLGDPGLFFTNNKFEALLWGNSKHHTSPALLLAALQYVERRNYRGLVLQPDSHDGMAPQEMKKLLSSYAEKQLQISDKGEVEIWKFKRGSSITFGRGTQDFAESYCKNHHFHFIGFEGLSHFKEEDYLSFFSCLKEDPQKYISQRIFSTGDDKGKYTNWVRERFIECPKDEMERNNRFVIVNK
jgi:hypothetical protein